MQRVRRTAIGLATALVMSGLVVLGATGRPGNAGTGAAFADRAALLELYAARAAGSIDETGTIPSGGQPPSQPQPVAGPATGRFSYPVLSHPAIPLAPLELDAGKLPSGQAIAGRLDGLLWDPRFGDRVAVAVVDPVTGRPIYVHDAGTGYTPASTTKLLTAAAVLSRMGPAARLRTTVVRTTGTDEIVLVGGGDPTLVSDGDSFAATGYPEPARLSTLAERTAKALVKAGVRKVNLRYDAGLFEGPARAASWAYSYVAGGSAVVTPVSALVVDHGYVGDPLNRIRSMDPARQAAELFARQLSAAGVKVSGPIQPKTAGAKATELAAVESPPLSAVVEHMLVDSDNDIAESLARHVAIASKQPATFDGAAATIRAAVGKLGVPIDEVRLFDGSGLSRANAIPARALADLLAVAAQPKHPKLRTLLAGLPVAGFSGTLADRAAKISTAGSAGTTTISAGLVRAKTGTLTGVRSLAGYVRTASGRLLMFAVLADRIPDADGDRAELALDAVAAALAGCCGR